MKPETTERRSSTPAPVQQAKAARRQMLRKNRYYILAAVAALLLIAGGIVAAVQLRRPQQSDANITYIGSIPVIQDYLPEGAAGRPGIKRTIEYVVIHETDNTNNGADAKAHNTYIHSDGLTREHSWHYTVDDHEIYHHLPDDEAAFHASDHLVKDGGNLNGIGVELCVNADGNYEKTLENAVQLTAKLLHSYGLTVKDVRKHQDFCGKICPSTLIRMDRWGEFLQRVQAAYDADAKK